LQALNNEIHKNIFFTKNIFRGNCKIFLKSNSEFIVCRFFHLGGRVGFISGKYFTLSIFLIILSFNHPIIQLNNNFLFTCVLLIVNNQLIFKTMKTNETGHAPKKYLSRKKQKEK